MGWQSPQNRWIRETASGVNGVVALEGSFFVFPTCSGKFGWHPFEIKTKKVETPIQRVRRFDLFIFDHSRKAKLAARR